MFIKTEVKKTKMFMIFLIVFILLVSIVLGFLLLRPKTPVKSSKSEYYPANYDENIFLNRAYMEFQRDMIYGIGGVEQLYSIEKDLASADPECAFFLKYFDAVVRGKYDEYKDFFVDGYFEEDPKFTMQMIYDPFVRFHSTSTDEIDGKEVTLLNFEVGYRIFKNNKTFRSDTSSNVLVPQIYQLIKTEGGSYKIFRILNIEVKDGN